jgi:adenine-specific DNA-methyltransferase
LSIKVIHNFSGQKPVEKISADALLKKAEYRRIEASSKLDSKTRSALGQFFTPAAVSQLMAQMVEDVKTDKIRLLDSGAGTGMLTAAFIKELCGWHERPKEIDLTVYEIDCQLIPYLKQTLADCQELCRNFDIKFSAEIKNEDFISGNASALSNNLFSCERRAFDIVLLNPPYGKINNASQSSKTLRAVGIEVPNLYAAFLALAAEFLSPNGQMIAITPRSFCNGTYFRRFRQFFLQRMTFKRFHVFDSRIAAFRDDDVLQENVIFQAVKNSDKTPKIIVSTSKTPDDEDFVFREIEQSELVRPKDKELFIHLGADELNNPVAERIKRFQTELTDLGLSVSTGRVVDFRVKNFLRRELNGENTAPLIYPHHLKKGFVCYPKPHPKKCGAIVVANETENLFVETGVYVLVKRFSAKEERRRITAAVFEPRCVEREKIGFENHLNYFHAAGKGIETTLARGLALYLNSSLVDAYFRQFNGHTQVNAGDLRYLKYPTRAELENLGETFLDQFPEQSEIDSLIDRHLFSDE